MRIRPLLLALCLLLTAPRVASPQQGEENLLVLRGEGLVLVGFTDARNSLYNQLHHEAKRHFQRRAAAVAAVVTADDWRARQAWVRETFARSLGPFPEKTPLNARVLGTLERPGYRIEKLVFESRPGQHVPAALYLPEGGGNEPRPAIVYFSGHSEEGFRGAVYQRNIVNLVRKGFIVLAVDPIGQGERVQYLDPETGRTRVGTNTLEHSYAGAQLFLTGESLAREFIWDGIRAIDYLVTRPEVDPERIGVTGRSGGGTQSAYVGAFDERVRASAPENYVTSLPRQWDTRGPPDAEQSFQRWIQLGLDQADLLVAHAPRSTLVIATTRDINNIQGTREAVAEAKRAYSAFGAPGALRMVEDDAGHASTPANREAMYAFFQEILELPGDPTDEDVEVPTPAELQVTPTGQVATSFGSEFPFSLNARVAEGQLAELRRRRASDPTHLTSALRDARELSGYVEPGLVEAPHYVGRYVRDGYTVEKYLVPAGEATPIIPFLLLRPSTPGPHPVLLYLHPEGKAAEVAPGGEMERLVRSGVAVAAPDLSGVGELGGGDYVRGNYRFLVGEAAYGPWFGSVITGRSIAALHAADIVRLARSLGEMPGLRADGMRAMALGETAPALLHAAAFEPSISAVALVAALGSYANLALTRDYRTSFIPGGVAGMLAAYDLPDLAASLAPRPLLILDPLDGAGAPLDGAEIEDAFAVVRAAYGRRGAAPLEVRTTRSAAEASSVVRAWLASDGSVDPSR